MSASDAVDGARSEASKCIDWLGQNQSDSQEGETRQQRRRLKFEGIGEDRRGNADKVVAGIGRTRVGQRTFKCVFLIGTRSAQSIMASGFTAAQTGRTRDRTRPTLQKRQKSSCQGAVHT
jgi:hypothetical protein